MAKGYPEGEDYVASRREKEVYGDPVGRFVVEGNRSAVSPARKR